MARLAASDAERDRERVKVLARVLEARTDELARQMALLADLSAVERGDLELDIQRVNLVPLVSGIVAKARTRSAVHRIKVSAPQGLTAVCDPNRVCAILEDLIRRAIRRNPRGCWVDVDVRRPLPGIARIDVRDYGRAPSIAERESWVGEDCPDRAWFVERRVAQCHRGALSVELRREGGVRATLSLPTRSQSRVAAPSGDTR